MAKTTKKNTATIYVISEASAYMDTDGNITVNSYADVANSRNGAKAKMRRLIEWAVKSHYEGSELDEEDISEIVKEILSNRMKVTPEKAEVYSWGPGCDCYSWKITKSSIPIADKV